MSSQQGTNYKEQFTSKMEFQPNVQEVIDAEGQVIDLTETGDFVPLPDLNDCCPDDYIYGGDASLWSTAEVEDEEDSPPSSPMVPNEDPFYPNQMQDPVVQQLMADDMDSLFDWTVNCEWQYCVFVQCPALSNFKGIIT